MLFNVETGRIGEVWALSAEVIHGIKGLNKLGENSCYTAFNILLSSCVTLEPKQR